MTLSISDLSTRAGDLRVKVGTIEDEIADFDRRIEAGPNAETIKVLSEARLKREGRVEELREQIAAVEGQVSRAGGSIGTNHPLASSYYAGPRPGDRNADKLPNLHSAGGQHQSVDPSGPRLSMFSSTTGRQFFAHCQGEPIAQEDCGSLTPADFVLAAATGSWNHVSDEERALAIELAQSTTGAAAGGVLVPDAIWPGHLNVLRNRTGIFRAGLPVFYVDDLPGNSVSITETATNPTGHWTGELEAATVSNATFRLHTLFHKKFTVMLGLSLETLDSAINARQTLDNALLTAEADAIDQGCLFGDATGAQMIGITNYSTVQTVSGVGTPSDYSDIISAVKLIYEQKYDSDASNLSWIQAPRDWATYAGLTATDGQPLRAPETVRKLKNIIASACPINLGGGAESKQIVGDFARGAVLFVKQRPVVELLKEGQVTDADDQTLNLITQNAAVLRLVWRGAIAVLRGPWFAVLDNCTSA